MPAAGRAPCPHGRGRFNRPARHRWDMALLPLRPLPTSAFAKPKVDRLQAWTLRPCKAGLSRPDRGVPPWPRGGGWWRTSAFPHGQLRPDLLSGTMSLPSPPSSSGAINIGWDASITSRQWFVAPMPTLGSCCISASVGAKTAHYPPALEVAPPRGAGGGRRDGAAPYRPEPDGRPVFGAQKHGGHGVYVAGGPMTSFLRADSSGHRPVDPGWAHPVHCHHPPLDAFGKARWKGRPATQFACAVRQRLLPPRSPPSSARRGFSCGRLWPRRAAWRPDPTPTPMTSTSRGRCFRRGPQ